MPTNAEKYSSPDEQAKAFHAYCKGKGNDCTACPLYDDTLGIHLGVRCAFAWLKLEAPMTTKEVADILAEFNRCRKWEGQFGKVGATKPPSPNVLDVAIDRAVEILRGLEE